MNYYALIWFKANLGYYFDGGITGTIEGNNATFADSDHTPYGRSSPYADGKGSVCAYVNIAAVHNWDDGKVTTEPSCTDKGIKTFTCKGDVSHTRTEDVDALGHDWGEWKEIKAATRETEGVEERVCVHDPAHKETRTIPKLPGAAGISIDPEKVEWTVEEGYKGATDDGLKEDAVQQSITAVSTGDEDIKYVLAEFKDTSSYEQFTVFAGGMTVTVAPREGLDPGTYTAVVVIGDGEDRFEDIEVPVTFTVTEKKQEQKPADEKGSSTQSKTDTNGSTTKKSNGVTSSASAALPMDNTSSPNTVSVPKTGDNSSALLWFVIICAAAGILFGTTKFIYRKK